MDVVMPQLGETVTEGVVTRWYKAVGDSVRADEMLFDVETDKVSTEIPAPASGVIAEILVQEGVTAKVGARLAVIQETAAAAVGAPASRTAPQAAIPAAPIKSQAPQTAAPAPAGKVHVAQTAAAAEPIKSQPPQTAAGAASAFPPPAGNVPRGADRLSPVVRKLVAEHRLNPAEIAGTGRDGRVTRDDVLGFIRQHGAPAAPQDARTKTAAATRKPLNSVRRRAGEHLLKSWQTVPHVLQAVEADFHKVEQARAAAGPGWKAREGFTLTYLPFIARAVAFALAKFPLLNASLDGDDMVLHARINLGVAVDLSFDGLVVPVVKDVAGRSLPQLARGFHDLAARARSNRLKPDDMTEATYTLSNSGVFGTLITAPIINPPQIAILSTDGVRKKPVVIEGVDGDSIAIRPVGVLAQSFDHRAVDGAYSAAFLHEVRTIIETRDWVGEMRG